MKCYTVGFLMAMSKKQKMNCITILLNIVNELFKNFNISLVIYKKIIYNIFRRRTKKFVTCSLIAPMTFLFELL